jgi:hypothetical protein
LVNFTKEKTIMSHEIFLRQKEQSRSSDREFGLVFSGFFAILAILDYLSKLPVSLTPGYTENCPFLVNHPEWAIHALSIVFATASLIFLIIALALPKALAPLNWIWAKFGVLLHTVVSPVVLSLLFFMVFTPVGVAMRLWGGDPLRLRFEPKAQSYWIKRNPSGPAPDSLKDQF